MKLKLMYLIMVLCMLLSPMSAGAEIQSLDDIDEFQVVMTDTYDQTQVSFLGYQANGKYYLPLNDLLTQLNYYVEFDEESNTIYATSLNSNLPEHIYEINLDEQTLIYHEKKGSKWIDRKHINLYRVDDSDNQIDGLALIDNETYIDSSLVTTVFKSVTYMNDNWQEFNRQEADFQINMQYSSEK